MARGRRGTLWAAVASGVVVVGVVAALPWVDSAVGWRGAPGSALSEALAAAPADTSVLGFTDWAALRDDDVTAADDRDLQTRSVLAALGDELQESFGWTVRDLRWESFVQDPGAGVLVVAPRFGQGRLEASLREAGLAEQSDGSWTAPDAGASPQSVDAQFAVVRLVPEAGVFVAGGDAAAVDDVVRTVRGADRSLASVRPAADAASALAGSKTVLLQAGDLACTAAAVPDDDAAQADAALARAGELASFTFAGRGIVDDGSAQEALFALSFPSVASAREQAGVRETLARGPFVGRSGRVDEELVLRDATVDRATTVLTFDRDPAGPVVMTGTGAWLFATC